MIDIPVLIVGGGPSGLMLANELGARQTPCLLVDAKPSTAFNPQANATQARTMEHYRRLGFAHEIRALGLPSDHPTDIAYFTRLSQYELARLALPTAAQAVSNIRNMSGSWSAAELPHRISQKYVEPVMRRHADRWPGVDIRFGWTLKRFEDQGTHVEAWIQPTDGSQPEVLVRARHLVGADGPRSAVRHHHAAPTSRLNPTASAVRRKHHMGIHDMSHSEFNCSPSLAPLRAPHAAYNARRKTQDKHKDKDKDARHKTQDTKNKDKTKTKRRRHGKGKGRGKGTGKGRGLWRDFEGFCFVSSHLSVIDSLLYILYL
jgi:2-polyprenyl-6-methoxyphenol hydroxylase-like FAD-dependent oxidoreductase